MLVNAQSFAFLRTGHHCPKFEFDGQLERVPECSTMVPKKIGNLGGNYPGKNILLSKIVLYSAYKNSDNK